MAEGDKVGLWGDRCRGSKGWFEERRGRKREEERVGMDGLRIGEGLGKGLRVMILGDGDMVEGRERWLKGGLNCWCEGEGEGWSDRGLGKRIEFCRMSKCVRDRGLWGIN
jgi:hypothetical protein